MPPQAGAAKAMLVSRPVLSKVSVQTVSSFLVMVIVYVSASAVVGQVMVTSVVEGVMTGSSTSADIAPMGRICAKSFQPSAFL